jgi:hypothetical protein
MSGGRHECLSRCAVRAEIVAELHGETSVSSQILLRVGFAGQVIKRGGEDMNKIVALAIMFAFAASTVVFVPNAHAKKTKKAQLSRAPPGLHHFNSVGT